MNYRDATTKPGKAGAYPVIVIHNGKFSTHWVAGKSYDDACNRLTKTRWYTNSGRIIVE